MTREDVLALISMSAWTAGSAVAGRHGIWLSLGAVAVVCGVILLVVDRARLFPLVRVTPGQILAGLAAGVAMSAATHALYPIAARIVPSVAAGTRQLYAAFASLSPTASALALAPVVVGEEVVWRGVVHGALARRVGPVAAVGIGAILYALAHAPVGSALLVVTALACGLVWGGLRASTGGLIAPLVSHLVWDVWVLLADPLVAR